MSIKFSLPSYIGNANAVLTVLPTEDGLFWGNSAAGSIILKHGGVVNGSQTILNLKAGIGVSILDDGVGTVTIASTAASTLTSAHLFVGSAFNVATDVPMSGDVVLSNTGVTTLIGAVRVITSRISLNAAQILALNATPFTIVAAPGTGKFIDLLSATARLTYGTTTYGGNTTLKLRMNTAGAFYLASNSNILGHGSSTMGSFALQEDTGNVIENKALELFAPIGNPTTGDGTLDIYVTYKISST